MSEQATNSQNKEAEVTAGLEKFFGGGDESPAPASKARDPESGKFVRTERQEPVEEPAQTEEPGTEATEENAQAQSEETEVEIEGERYLVPKKIADRFIQHADYTRKTQDTAELRRVTTAERETLNLERAFEQAVSAEKQTLAIIDAQLAQFQGVNWQTLETQDLLRARAQMDQLRDQRALLDSQIKAKRGQFDEKITSLRTEAKVARDRFVKQHIKDWDEKLEKTLHEYGKGEGYSEQELGSMLDPRVVVSLWKAQQYDAIKASNPAVLNKARQAAPVVKPGPVQNRPNRIQQLSKAVQAAKTPQQKKQAVEDLLTAKLGG